MTDYMDYATCKKPPLGVKPKDIQAAERIADLAKAIERYALADNLKEAAEKIEALAYEITWQAALIKDVEDVPSAKNYDEKEALKWHNLTFTSKLNALNAIDKLDQINRNMRLVTVEDFCKAHDMFESKIDNKQWPAEYKEWGWLNLDMETLTVMQYPGRQLWVILMPNPLKIERY